MKMKEWTNEELAFCEGFDWLFSQLVEEGHIDPRKARIPALYALWSRRLHPGGAKVIDALLNGEPVKPEWLKQESNLTYDDITALD
tara:strand:- start:992 stop:1249 length:258 start_codon:yes stop_codon:yes gene_type:complete